MKKLGKMMIFASIFMLIFSTNVWAEENKNALAISNQNSTLAQDIYKICEKNVDEKYKTDFDNYEYDVKRAISLQICLKDAILEISKQFMPKENIKKLSKALNKMKDATKTIYTYLLYENDFKEKNHEMEKISSKYYDEAFSKNKTIENGLIERKITAQMYKILQDTINVQQHYGNIVVQSADPHKKLEFVNPLFNQPLRPLANQSAITYLTPTSFKSMTPLDNNKIGYTGDCLLLENEQNRITLRCDLTAFVPSTERFGIVYLSYTIEDLLTPGCRVIRERFDDGQNSYSSFCVTPKGYSEAD